MPELGDSSPYAICWSESDLCGGHYLWHLEHTCGAYGSLLFSSSGSPEEEFCAAVLNKQCLNSVRD